MNTPAPQSKIKNQKSKIPMPSPQSLSLPALYQVQLQRLLAHQQAIEAELAKRNLQELPIEKLFRLSDLLSRQLQRLLKAAPEASGVEVRFQRAGEGGILPPVPTPSASNPIKVDQASREPAATEAPSPDLKVQSSTFEVQGSGPSPQEPASSPIKADQASCEPAPTNAPSPDLKVQSSTPNVQCSSPSTLNSQPSTLLEHCLRCAAPLPPLLPNGRRPDRSCPCGSPIMAPPGTSLLERCPDCGEPQRPHGYNAIRQDNRCHKCWRNLPPLDPKSPTPWLPPAQPAALVSR